MSVVNTTLADQNFQYWRSEFERITGIRIVAERENFVRSVLQKRAAAKGETSFDGYLFKLLSRQLKGSGEWQTVCDQIVIGETRFFRHRPSFDFVAKFVGEQFKQVQGSRPVIAWSLGCSTGEEAYSLAMVMYKVSRGEVAPRNFHVLASDINRSSIEYAARGIYQNIFSRGIDEQLAGSFFDDVGSSKHQVKSFLKAKLEFFCQNMLESAGSSLISGVDIICCQNVLIYLQPERRKEMVRKWVKVLNPGGVLMVGPGELSSWKPEEMERVSGTEAQAYRRVF